MLCLSLIQMFTQPLQSTLSFVPPCNISLRSRDGCLTCRRRRVKCDETKPTCGKCSVKHRQCMWPVDHTTTGHRRRSTRWEDKAPNPPDATLSGWFFDELSTPVDSGASGPLPQKGPVSLKSARFYIPPDALPDLPLAEQYQLLLSSRQQDYMFAPSRKAQMMADPAFLRSYFPSMDERLIMRHFLLYTTSNLLAFGCQRRPWNPWIEMVVPLAFNHLPGHSSASDALRIAMLAIGSVDMRFRDEPTDQQTASSIVRSAKSKILSLVKNSIDTQETTGTPLDKADVEMILAALICCAVASSLAADPSWDDLFDTIHNVVGRLGGAEALLKEGSTERLSSFRFFLEQLAVRDIFGCMTTEKAPRILNVAFSPWFYEAEQWSQGDHEWESVERMFGISRGMVDFIARSCTLISKVRQSSHSSFVTNEFPLRLPAHAVARLAPASPLSIAGDLSRNALLAEANDLMAELTVWYQTCGYTPNHPRVQYGNHTYRHTIRIRLLREVYGVEQGDAAVQESVRAIMELATEMVAACGRITWMTWPVIIAGANMLPDDPNRELAVKLLGEFARYACFDNAAACRMLTNLWKDASERVCQSAPLAGTTFFD